MELLELSVLAGAALATSILSAVVGMAGGITLLSVMLLFLDPLVAIPLHGAVQLVSNARKRLAVSSLPKRRTIACRTFSAMASDSVDSMVV